MHPPKRHLNYGAKKNLQKEDDDYEEEKDCETERRWHAVACGCQKRLRSDPRLDQKFKETRGLRESQARRPRLQKRVSDL